jgi:hypothetical protein
MPFHPQLCVRRQQALRVGAIGEEGKNAAEARRAATAPPPARKINVHTQLNIGVDVLGLGGRSASERQILLQN